MEMLLSYFGKAWIGSKKRQFERRCQLHSVMCQFRSSYEGTRYSTNKDIPMETRMERSIKMLEQVNHDLQGISPHGFHSDLARKYGHLRALIHKTWQMHQKGQLDQDQWHVRHIAIGRQLGVVMHAIGTDPQKGMLKHAILAGN